jgi:hypothetical protein
MLQGSKQAQQRAASEEQRLQLIAQLVQQEGPAQAALDALKQVCHRHTCSGLGPAQRLALWGVHPSSAS